MRKRIEHLKNYLKLYYFKTEKNTLCNKNGISIF